MTDGGAGARERVANLDSHPRGAVEAGTGGDVEEVEAVLDRMAVLEVVGAPA